MVLSVFTWDNIRGLESGEGGISSVASKKNKKLGIIEGKEVEGIALIYVKRGKNEQILAIDNMHNRGSRAFSALGRELFTTPL